MKILKTLTCTIAAAAALAFSTSSATAVTSIGLVTNYSVLNISLTIKTNVYSYNSSTSVEKYTVGSKKFVTKDLMNLLAGPDFHDAAFPAGAKLVQGWDAPWDGDVLVVLGTNVLYNASAGSYYVRIYWDEYSGTYAENYKDTSPGYYDITDYNTGYFEIYDDDYSYFDLYGYGPATATYKQNWNADVYTGWSQNANMTPSYGDNYFGDSSEGFTSGTITTSGSGKGVPYYWWY
jgi:hypothetical protein